MILNGRVSRPRQSRSCTVMDLDQQRRFVDQPGYRADLSGEIIEAGCENAFAHRGPRRAGYEIDEDIKLGLTLTRSDKGVKFILHHRIDRIVCPDATINEAFEFENQTAHSW